MAGRPTRLTAAVLEEICRALRAGASVHIAADSLGVPLKTVLSWIRLGEEARDCDRKRCREPHHGPRGVVSYATVATEVQKATGQAGLRAAASWTAEFQRDPRLAMNWLAKRYPKDFGSRAEAPPVEQTGRTGLPFVIQLVESNRPPSEIEELEQLIRSPAAAAATAPPAAPNEGAG